MNTPASITKSEIVWLIVRTIGLVLLLQAILRLPSLAGVVAWVISIGEPSSATETLRSATISKTLTGDIFSVVLHGGIGLYLLCKGQWVHSVLARSALIRPNDIGDK